MRNAGSATGTPKCDGRTYYKLRQVLHSAMINTNCDSTAGWADLKIWLTKGGLNRERGRGLNKAFTVSTLSSSSFTDILRIHTMTTLS